MTDGIFEFPKDYDIEEVYNQNFGIIKEGSYEVEIEFSGWAAHHVSERIWSSDQRIQKKKGGKIILAFSASSKPELISWTLSFGAEARVIKPRWLANAIKRQAGNILGNYA